MTGDVGAWRFPVSAMTYVTEFDAARDGHVSWWLPAFWLAYVIGAAVVVRAEVAGNSAFARLLGRPPSVRAWVGLGFFSLVLSSILTGDYVNMYNASSALREGRYRVVAGPVTGFDRYYGGVFEKGETFVVAGKRFTVSPYDGLAGFHQMSSQGSPIRDGLNVRIAYSGSKILRLEVAK